MKYLCLAYYDEKKFEALTEAELAAIPKQCRPLDAALEESGRLVAVASLAPTPNSTSIRPRGGKPLVTDGPYAETKEQLGSFFIIEADDLDDAIRVASLHPAAQLNEQLGWGIELRPIEVFSTDKLTCRLEVSNR
jgi:hypothetical protein